MRRRAREGADGRCLRTVEGVGDGHLDGAWDDLDRAVGLRAVDDVDKRHAHPQPPHALRAIVLPRAPAVLNAHPTQLSMQSVVGTGGGARPTWCHSWWMEPTPSGVSEPMLVSATSSSPNTAAISASSGWASSTAR